uniref:Non-ltr rnase hi domain of reverse transcriptase n=1 Tax=Rhipicephalus zambeziensis TaxID=60191 RepID=A0A224Z061_9ACAR
MGRPPTTSDLKRQEETCLHRIRLNVAYTNYFRHKIGLSDSPLCLRCDVPEDLNHVLCECRLYASERQSMKEALKLQQDSNLELKHILGPWQTSSTALRATKALLTFLRATSLNETL